MRILTLFDGVYNSLQYSPLAFFFIVMSIWGVGLLYLSIWRESGRDAFLGMVFFLLALSLYKDSVMPARSYFENTDMKYLSSLVLLTVFIIACLYCTVRAIITETEMRHGKEASSRANSPAGRLLQTDLRRGKKT